MNGQRNRGIAAHDAADANVTPCLLQPFAADPEWYRRYWYGDRDSRKGSAARQVARAAAAAVWQLAPAASRVAVTLVVVVGILAATASYLLR